MTPVALDGYIYIIIALSAAAVASFGSDDASKYIPLATLWWLKNVFGWLGASSLALKMYRSTTFAEYKAVKNGTYHAETTTTAVTTNVTDTPKKEEIKTNEIKNPAII